MNKNFITWTIIIVLASLSIWYFFLKDYDYSISFNSPVSAGELYQANLNYEYGYMEQPVVGETEPFSKIYKKTSIEGDTINLLWEFFPEDKSGSVAKLKISHPQKNLLTRWQLLFGKTEEQHKIIEETKRFQESTIRNLDLYDITYEGITQTPEAFCACIQLENGVNSKAIEMIKNIDKLSNFVIDNDLKMAGKPRIEILRWDLAANYIAYNFCFPVNTGKNKEISSPLFYKTLPSRPALKAIYKGNYMYSHLAWVNLLEQARNLGHEVVPTPLEIFNDNPEMGGDSRNWETEVYLPLK